MAFATRFDNADLSGAVFRNAMLMNSKFTGAQIEGTDFTDAVLDLPQQKALCARLWRQPSNRRGDAQPGPSLISA